MTQEQEIRATLIYRRRNRTETDLAETFGVSQATISRAITRWTPRLVEALRHLVPTVDDLDPRRTVIIDDTLVPCWDWADQTGLYSEKYHTTGLNLQIACDLDGNLLWISDPAPGSTHDAKAILATGILDHFQDVPPIGDKGFIELGMITPDRKPAGGELTDEQKAYNKSINSIRAAVEQAIAHLKTWWILHTTYRRPFHSFTETISAVIALELFKPGFE